MIIAIIFKSNTYETNHKGEITEVIPPLLFQQLINLLFQFLILSLQKALLFQGFLFMLLRFLNLHTKRDQLMLQIIHLLILLLKVLLKYLCLFLCLEIIIGNIQTEQCMLCLLYTSPSPRD